jgi:hypothetical protein
VKHICLQNLQIRYRMGRNISEDGTKEVSFVYTSNVCYPHMQRFVNRAEIRPGRSENTPQAPQLIQYYVGHYRVTRHWSHTSKTPTYESSRNVALKWIRVKWLLNWIKREKKEFQQNFRNYRYGTEQIVSLNNSCVVNVTGKNHTAEFSLWLSSELALMYSQLWLPLESKFPLLALYNTDSCCCYRLVTNFSSGRNLGTDPVHVVSLGYNAKAMRRDNTYNRTDLPLPAAVKANKYTNFRMATILFFHVLSKKTTAYFSKIY